MTLSLTLLIQFCTTVVLEAKYSAQGVALCCLSPMLLLRGSNSSSKFIGRKIARLGLQERVARRKPYAW